MLLTHNGRPADFLMGPALPCKAATLLVASAQGALSVYMVILTECIVLLSGDRLRHSAPVPRRLRARVRHGHHHHDRLLQRSVQTVRAAGLRGAADVARTVWQLTRQSFNAMTHAHAPCSFSWKVVV